jgi:hypothetical protein
MGMPDINHIGIVVVYYKPDDIKKFETLYQQHLRLFDEMFGNIVENCKIVKLDDEVFYQFSIIEFKPGTDISAVMNSSEMKIVVDDVLKFVPEDKVKILPITQTL